MHKIKLAYVEGFAMTSLHTYVLGINLTLFFPFPLPCSALTIHPLHTKILPFPLSPRSQWEIKRQKTVALGSS